MTFSCVEALITAVLGVYGVIVPTEGNTPHNVVSLSSICLKSPKNLSPRIIDSVAFYP